MDLNEKPPKIKKRVGAEFKLKLRSKDGTPVVRFCKSFEIDILK